MLCQSKRNLSIFGKGYFEELELVSYFLFLSLEALDVFFDSF